MNREEFAEEKTDKIKRYRIVGKTSKNEAHNKKKSTKRNFSYLDLIFGETHWLKKAFQS